MTTKKKKKSADVKARVKLMTVTPEMAARWLDETNTRNRRMNMPKVEQFARDMKAGHWLTTHQGIAFDTKGVLIDGQTRLAAIVRAETPVTMHVWHGVSSESQQAVDQLTSRSIADALTLTGNFGVVTKKDVACLRAMIAGMATRRKLTVAETGELLAIHREAIEFAMKNSSDQIRGTFTATTRAVVARAWYLADHGKLRRFCDVLRTGLATQEGDAPIALLWRYLIQTATSQSQRPLKHRYSKIERALHAFLNGEKITKLYLTKQELFPLPQEVEENEKTKMKDRKKSHAA